MIAQTLLNKTIPALKPNNTFIQALEWMGEQHIQHLAYVNEEGFLQSIISEYQVLDQEDLYEQLEVIEWNSAETTAYKNDSVFELLVKMQQHKLSAIPVVDDLGRYQGLVTQQMVINALANQYSFYGKGGLIALVMPAAKYSMAEIAQIVESNEAKVLSSILDYDAEASEVRVLLKVNTPETMRLIATFERYDYEAEAIIQADLTTGQEDLQENYDALMHYLNI